MLSSQNFFNLHILVLHYFTALLSKKEVMPRQKAKQNTTYRERYNVLSALEVHMQDNIQKLWTLCALQLKTVDQMLMVSIMLELDLDGDFVMILLFMLWNHCVHFFPNNSTIY